MIIIFDFSMAVQTIKVPQSASDLPQLAYLILEIPPRVCTKTRSRNCHCPFLNNGHTCMSQVTHIMPSQKISVQADMHYCMCVNFFCRCQMQVDRYRTNWTIDLFDYKSIEYCCVGSSTFINLGSFKQDSISNRLKVTPCTR